LSVEARLGDCIEQIQIGFPYAMLEPLIRQLSLKLAPESDEPNRSAPAAKPKWKSDFDDVRIPVGAEWSGLRLTARVGVSLIWQLAFGVCPVSDQRLDGLLTFSFRTTLGHFLRRWRGQAPSFRVGRRVPSVGLHVGYVKRWIRSWASPLILGVGTTSAARLPPACNGWGFALR